MSNDNYLMHYGMLRLSGRYPYGSGKDPYKNAKDFLTRYEQLKHKKMTDSQIAEELGLKHDALRTQISLAKFEKKMYQVHQIQNLKDKGWSLRAIAEELHISNESTVRSLLNIDLESKRKELMGTADFIKNQIDKKGMIMLGPGVPEELGITADRLKQAVHILEQQDYPLYYSSVKQATDKNRQTNLQVICPPGTQKKEAYEYEKLNTLMDYNSVDDKLAGYHTLDRGQTFNTFQYPKSLDSSRVYIRYDEDGGSLKDGLVEIRPNVPDISLGTSNYSQVRILVDDKMYIKGMAAYNDDIPKGYDMVFNTNKSRGTPKEKVYKPITDDPDNPFGSYIKPNGQSYYKDKNGENQLSVINKRADEGDWGEWSDKLPTQFLSKQSKSLIKTQLDATYEDRINEYNEIMSLTNPTIKKHLLENFANDCDGAAVHLKAKGFPGQKYQVLMPLTTMKDTEIYAPNYEDGSQLALIRYPHGGTFEIPILTVNNKNKEGSKLLSKSPIDAVGVTKKTLDQMSGADCDGDTATVIPIGKGVKIDSKPPLKELEGFDTKSAYPEVEGMKYMKYLKDPNDPKTEVDNTQKQMGMISNLITDMQLIGAPDADIAKAVKHSMVVIDAAKHKLNYKKSEIDNDIKQLKIKYQGVINPDTGKLKTSASTLISRATSEVTVTRYKGNKNIDPTTGKLGYDAYTSKQKAKEVATRYDPTTGIMVARTMKSKQLAETDDAFTLSSGTVKETLYADYSNKLKALANTTRKSMLTTGNLVYNASANKLYKEEAISLDNKLKEVLKNKPRERAAQAMVQAIMTEKKLTIEMNGKEEKKAAQQALDKARAKYGAKKPTIDITDKEWQAIQAGAISDNKLKQIINNTDVDVIRSYATPKTSNTLSTVIVNKVNTLLAKGTLTNSEIAKALNISVSSVQSIKKGE